MVGPSRPPDAPLPCLPPRLPTVTDPNVQPPRPPNSWILYRAWRLKHLPPPGPGEGRRSQSDVSTLVSFYWRNETTEVKDHFERLADEAKVHHKAQYPNYRYQPKKKEDGKAPRPPKVKKAIQAIRGTSRETDATPAPAEQRTGHPYASSSRPSREPAVRIPPSPPISAASSPSIGPSTPTSIVECPELELEPSSSKGVVDLTSPSPEASAPCQNVLQTPAPEAFDNASISLENLYQTPASEAFDNATIPSESLYQTPAPEAFGDASVSPVTFFQAPVPEAIDDTSASPLDLPETPATNTFDDASNYPQDIPTTETSDYTPSWDFPAPEIPLHLMPPVHQGDTWSDQYFTNANFNNQQPALSYEIPLDSSNFGTGETEVLACGHPAMGQHSAQCFLSPGRTEQFDLLQREREREIEIVLGNVLGVVSPFGDAHGDVLFTHNPAYDNPLYPQDASSLPFSLEQDHSAPNHQDFSFQAAEFYLFDNALTAEVPQPSVQALVAPPYVPPSGAAHSATRRVGGNWTGYARDMDMDLTPASHFEVHAS